MCQCRLQFFQHTPYCQLSLNHHTHPDMHPDQQWVGTLAVECLQLDHQSLVGLSIKLWHLSTAHLLLKTNTFIISTLPHAVLIYCMFSVNKSMFKPNSLSLTPFCIMNTMSHIRTDQKHHSTEIQLTFLQHQTQQINWWSGPPLLKWWPLRDGGYQHQYPWIHPSSTLHT